MSQSIEGQKCTVCSAYLFDDDDIVYCPVCGAPHHRDCYNALGHCALESDHGTDKQYDIVNRSEEPKGLKEEKVDTSKPVNEVYRCVSCGTEMEPDAQFCPNCRTPRMTARSITITPFGTRFYRKWKDDTIIEEDITLKEMLPIVGTNAARYGEKFVTLGKGNKTSWNWAAFLFPAGWAMSRKCFKYGIIFLTAMVASALLSIPMQKILSLLPQEGATSSDIVNLITNGGIIPTLLYFASGVINIATRVLAALFADYIYRAECIERVKLIRKSGDEKETLYYKLGGVNLWWFIFAAIAQSYLPTIISAFF